MKTDKNERRREKGKRMMALLAQERGLSSTGQ